MVRKYKIFVVQYNNWTFILCGFCMWTTNLEWMQYEMMHIHKWISFSQL